MLQPVMIVNVTLSLMGAFNVFDIPYVMTEGGPANSTNVMALHNISAWIQVLPFWLFSRAFLCFASHCHSGGGDPAQTDGARRTTSNSGFSSMVSNFKQDTSPQPTGVHWRPYVVMTFNHALLLLFTVIIIYPVVWMVLASLKTPGEFVSNVWGIPTELDIDNYSRAWELANLGRSLINSLIVSMGTVILVVALSSIAGYAFAKFSFRFSAAILLVMIFTMQAPTPVIPFYVLFVRLGLTDS